MAQEANVAGGLELGAEGSTRQERASLERARLHSTPGFYRRAWQRFYQSKVSMVALIVALLIVAFSLGAPLIAEYVTGFSYREGKLGEQLIKPFDRGHILGTDANGRDVLTRLAYGGRISLLVASLAAATTLVIGASVGAVSGYFGGFVDALLMRIVDVLLCVPFLSILLLVSALYRPGPIGIALILAIFGWPGISRLIRGEVLSLRSRDFVDAARVVGASNGRIIFRHIVPNVIPLMVVWLSLAIPGLILAEAGLSFLGFGVQIPTPSWGNMLEGAREFYNRSWTNVFIPGFMIYLTVLSINVVGKGLRDALDPRLNN